MYYTISDVAGRVNMSVSTLRYYDYQGILSFVKKDANGYRLFTEEDISDILMIKELKNCGIPLKAIKEFFEIYRQSGKDIQVQRRFLYAYEQDLLQKIKDDLECLQLLQQRLRSLDSAEQHNGEAETPDSCRKIDETKNISHVL